MVNEHSQMDTTIEELNATYHCSLIPTVLTAWDMRQLHISAPVLLIKSLGIYGMIFK